MLCGKLKCFYLWGGGDDGWQGCKPNVISFLLGAGFPHSAVWTSGSRVSCMLIYQHLFQYRQNKNKTENVVLAIMSLEISHCIFFE